MLVSFSQNLDANVCLKIWQENLEIHSMFCRNPESDFTRNRELSFREYIQFMLQMQSKSVSNEILDFFEHSLSAPSKSAFTQQRYKLLPEGWDFLVQGKRKKIRNRKNSIQIFSLIHFTLHVRSLHFPFF